MTNYLPARQRLGYAVRKLDEKGSLHGRLEAAWLQLVLLGQVGIFVPSGIAGEVEKMHETVAAGVIQGRANSVGRAVRTLTDEECEAEIARVRRWAEAVEAAA